MYSRFLILLCLALWGVPSSAQVLRGSGSTFAADLYGAWAQRLQGHRLEMSYEAAGSSTGVKRAVAHDVDFGASDRPLARNELDGSGLAQFPAAVGAVVVTAHVPGVAPDTLRLDGAALADLYLGKIRMWNDPAIAALNPGLRLPAVPVVPIVRGAGSGTSYAFSQYLSKVSTDFASSVGPTSDLQVPKARVVQSNREVSETVQAVEGAVAYLDFSYVTAHKVPTVALQNRWGTFVKPSEQTIQDAMRLADWEKTIIDQSPTFAMDLTDAGCPSCWPISTLTYVLVPLHGAGGSSERVFEFFQRALDDGDALAKGAGYVPLPSKAKWRVKLQMRKWLEGNPRGKLRAQAGPEQPWLA
jgi:phosphate transport system substrate-binding protein